MPKFRIGVKEVHMQEITIEAETVEEAISRIEEGEGIEGKCEYRYTLDSDEWTILEANLE